MSKRKTPYHKGKCAECGNSSLHLRSVLGRLLCRGCRQAQAAQQNSKEGESN